MPGLLRGVARTAVIAGTATAVSNRVSRRQARRWGGEDQSAYQEPEPAPQEPAEVDVVAQLRDLASLHKDGILTDEEFAAQKSKILAS
jgi:Short C-terminal domain